MNRASIHFIAACIGGATLFHGDPIVGSCFGDLNADGRVTVDEVLIVVDRALFPARNPTPVPTRETPTRVPTRSARPTRTPIASGQDTAQVRKRNFVSSTANVGTVTGVDDLILAVDNALSGCPPQVCEPGSVRDNFPHIEVRETAAGLNGTFTDACSDDLLALTEWYCGLVRECGRWPNPLPSDCTTFETGTVVSRVHQCSGGCLDGTCRARCPGFSDTLLYVDREGTSAILENETDGRQYDCVLISSTEEGLDCETDPRPGDREEIVGLGLRGRLCTGDDFGLVELANGCAYTCGIKLGSDRSPE